MVSQDSLLVTLVKLVDQLPMSMPAQKRGRGHPKVYPDRLFLKALVVMIVRHLHNVHELLSVLGQPTEEMCKLRESLCEQGRFPARRTWERRLKALPDTLPAQIGCLGRHLIDLIQPWESLGRAVAIDSNTGSGSHENGCPFKVIAIEKEGQTRIMHEQGFGERECFANKPS